MEGFPQSRRSHPKNVFQILLYRTQFRLWKTKGLLKRLDSLLILTRQRERQESLGGGRINTMTLRKARWILDGSIISIPFLIGLILDDNG